MQKMPERNPNFLKMLIQKILYNRQQQRLREPRNKQETRKNNDESNLTINDDKNIHKSLIFINNSLSSIFNNWLFLYTNLDSLLLKLKEFLCTIPFFKPHISLIITESWLNSISDS